jgi:hypothetical protein
MTDAAPFTAAADAAAPAAAEPVASPGPADRPEVLVGAAFAGGVVLALLLKRAGRVS